MSRSSRTEFPVNRYAWCPLLIVALVLSVSNASARGFRGGGMRGGLSRGGAISRSPSFSRAPSFNRAPSFSRTPSYGRSPSSARPGVSRAPYQRASSRSVSRPGSSVRTPGQSTARPGSKLRSAGPSRVPSGTARTGARPTRQDVGRFLNLPKNAATAAGAAVAAGAFSDRLQTRTGNADLSARLRSRANGADGARNRLPAERQQRLEQRHARGNEVRDHLRGTHGDLFTPGWRLRHPNLARANYRYNHRNSWHWWYWASWPVLNDWWTWTSWGEPIYYDYGPGGNVVYENNTVYVDGEAVGSEDKFAGQAQQLAASGVQELEAADEFYIPGENDDDKWLPLGTFALTEPAGTEPTMFLQLAVDRQGVVTGTWYNSVTEQAAVIQGSVDRETQRVAIIVEGRPQTVLETGIYNLTQDETQALIHFGTGKTQTWLLVRMEPPDAETTGAQ